MMVMTEDSVNIPLFVLCQAARAVRRNTRTHQDADKKNTRTQPKRTRADTQTHLFVRCQATLGYSVPGRVTFLPRSPGALLGVQMSNRCADVKYKR